MTTLDFRLLGALEIRSAERSYLLRGSMQNALLTTLLVSDGHSVSASDLIDELWGQGRPAAADNALHAHISRLRRTLEGFEPDRPRPRLLSSDSQYLLEIDDGDSLDTSRFVRAVEEISRIPARPGSARAPRLRAALGLWRGNMLGGVTGGPICQAAADRLADCRMQAYEMLFDAELDSGNHAQIVPELRALISRGSDRIEHHCEQLLLALYRCGRHADALEVYRDTWKRMVTSIGIQPSPSLRRYESAILRHDPILHAPHARKALAGVAGAGGEAA